VVLGTLVIQGCTQAATKYDELRLRAIAAQRAALHRLRARGEIGEGAFHRIQEELDWSELDAAPAGSFQSLALRPLMRLLRFEDDGAVERELSRARVAVMQAAARSGLRQPCGRPRISRAPSLQRVMSRRRGCRAS
jgi:hypothetical protein